MGVRELLVGEHIHVLGGWHLPTPLGQKLLNLGPFWTSPSDCSFVSFLNKRLIIVAFLSSKVILANY